MIDPSHLGSILFNSKDKITTISGYISSLSLVVVIESFCIDHLTTEKIFKQIHSLVH